MDLSENSMTFAAKNRHRERFHAQTNLEGVDVLETFTEFYSPVLWLINKPSQVEEIQSAFSNNLIGNVATNNCHVPVAIIRTIADA